MSKENGFAPIRRGLWEHVRDGRLSLQDVAVYQYIISQADTRTGIWKGSAGALAGELGMTKRVARHVLERLEHGDYLRRFAKPGQRFCYAIVVHKFEVTQGQHKGEVVDALSSTFENGCLTLAYFVRQVEGQVEGQVMGQVSAPQRIQDTGKGTREKKKEAQAPPSLSFSGQHFSVTEKQDALLGEAFPWIDRPAEYRKADSWLEANPERRPKKVNQFLHNWFSRITQPKGKDNGSTKKLAGDDLTTANLKAAGFVQ